MKHPPCPLCGTRIAGYDVIGTRGSNTDSCRKYYPCGCTERTWETVGESCHKQPAEWVWPDR